MISLGKPHRCSTYKHGQERMIKSGHWQGNGGSCDRGEAPRGPGAPCRALHPDLGGGHNGTH